MSSTSVSSLLPLKELLICWTIVTNIKQGLKIYVPNSTRLMQKKINLDRVNAEIRESYIFLKIILKIFKNESIGYNI